MLIVFCRRMSEIIVRIINGVALIFYRFYCTGLCGGLVSAIAPTEKTVIAESTPAMIFLKMLVFFIVFTPFEFVVFVLVLLTVLFVVMFVFFMMLPPFVSSLFSVISVYQVEVDSLFTDPRVFKNFLFFFFGVVFVSFLYCD